MDDTDDAEPAEAAPRHGIGIDIDEEHRFDYALQGSEQSTRFVNHTKLVDYSYYYFPFHPVSTVVFPEQKQPLMFKEYEADAYEKFISAANSDYFIVLFPKHIAECQTPPFIATVCKVVQNNQESHTVEMLGMHRCKVLERNDEKGEVRAQLLPEIELPSVLPKILPKYARNQTLYDKYSLATRISGYPFDVVRDVTKRNVDRCTTVLKEMVGEEIVDGALSRGLTSFSYFVARQMLSNQEIEYNILKENSADARIDTAAKYFEVVEAVCKNCHIQLFKNEHILRLSDLNFTHVNEHGFVHQISLLSELSSFEEASMPSFQYTWFPGYAWVILVCSGCDEHIGWKYISETQTPQVFFGVRRDAVSYHYRPEEGDGGGPLEQ